MKFHSFACVWACEEAGACVNQTPLVRAPAPHRPGRSSTLTRYQDALLVLAGIRIMLSRLWQTLFSAPSEPVEWQESALLCLGLDGAGKSSLIRWAFDGTQADAGDAAPTAGFNVRRGTAARLQVRALGARRRPVHSALLGKVCHPAAGRRRLCG